MWALTRVLGVSSCFGGQQPIKAITVEPSTVGSLAEAPPSTSAKETSAEPVATPAEASVTAGVEKRAWTLEATAVGASSEATASVENGEQAGCVAGNALNDTEVNDALVKALLGLVDGGGEACWAGESGWTGCHWETVCVTDGVTVYRARYRAPSCRDGYS
jgi:hypothetical protein